VEQRRENIQCQDPKLDWISVAALLEAEVSSGGVKVQLKGTMYFKTPAYSELKLRNCPIDVEDTACLKAQIS